MSARCRSAGLLLYGALQLVGLLKVSSLPYTTQNQCRNPRTERYDEAIRKCCSLCPPGSRVREKCTENADTKCVACDEGTYTEVWSAAGLCFSCSPPCKTGWVQTKECTRRQDRSCQCPPHHFCHLPRSGPCRWCKLYQQCQKGFGVAKQGTENSDVECVPCGPGTFSDVESHSASCRPHRICESEITPGNSTHDAVCRDLGVPVGTVATPLRTTLTAKSHLVTPLHTTLTAKSHFVTRSPTGKTVVQQPPADMSQIAGLVAGVACAIFALIGGTCACFVLRKKGHRYVLPFAKEKQPFSCPEKAPTNWHQDTHALQQEEQNLLQVSASSSGSLDSPPASEKSSGVSSEGTLSTDTERTQQRSSPSNTCVHHSGANSKQSSSGGTHVNVSCTVSICNALDHSLPFQLLNASGASSSRDCTLAEDLPLSKEESPLKKESGTQIAEEVEDNMDAFDHSVGKALPLSIQDVGMKAT
ncbi:tumor necrosis factor receptor superfamily member 1B-like [Podarcis lilfordi]|uniref:Tumor necrosis factor receptor superfamily member 1B-like n=1 Tax=Podarcis lilfordi TaxID=74358 RepID=A0AA35PEA8_9SAUR|nr:tumor necrosis factor receptor superfamily member 1B-like [Podarcis lilfordi]